MATQLSDKDLMLRYAHDRNKMWLGIALERYTIILMGVCMKYLNEEEDAKDVIQQVYIKALQQLENQVMDNLGGWLYRVAKNECLDLLRRRTNRRMDALQEHIPDEENIDFAQLIDQEITEKQLHEAITTLKEEQRICIELFYFQQKSYQEITELTKFDLKQVKSNIQNGKRNLKIKLEQVK